MLDKHAETHHVDYFFTYDESTDIFGDAFDRQVIREVFGGGIGDRPLYNKVNKLWTARYIVDMIQAVEDQHAKKAFENREQSIRGEYDKLVDLVAKIAKQRDGI